MNWILGIVVLGCFLVTLEVLRRQIKSDREFMDWLLSQEERRK